MKKEKKDEKEAENLSSDKLKVGRALTSQEESILLPLIKGLIVAGGGTPEQVAKIQAKATKQQKPKSQRKVSRVRKSVKQSDTEQSAKSK